MIVSGMEKKIKQEEEMGSVRAVALLNWVLSEGLHGGDMKVVRRICTRWILG